LKLKDEVDAGDAREALDYYNALVSHHRETIQLPTDPKDVAFTESLNIIKMCKVPIARDELVRIICQKKEYLKTYLTKRPMKLDVNKPLKRLHEMLVNHRNIRVVNHNPTVYQWVEEEDDSSSKDSNSNNDYNTEENCNQTIEKKADQTDRSDPDFDTHRIKNRQGSITILGNNLSVDEVVNNKDKSHTNEVSYTGDRTRSNTLKESSRMLEKNNLCVKREWSERSVSDSTTFPDNNFIIEKDKEEEEGITAVLDIEEQKRRAAIIRTAQGYACVYCLGFESKYQEDYERHILTKHPDHLPCPTDEDLDLNGGKFKRGVVGGRK
jgi:hypothetical protein